MACMIHNVMLIGARYQSNFIQTNGNEPLAFIQASRLRALADAALHIEKAKRIVVIGGGPVGVELTGEIAQKYPDKVITLVHAHDRLMQRHDVSVAKRAHKWLETKNVKVSS